MATGQNADGALSRLLPQPAAAAISDDFPLTARPRKPHSEDEDFAIVPVKRKPPAVRRLNRKHFVLLAAEHDRGGKSNPKNIPLSEIFIDLRHFALTGLDTKGSNPLYPDSISFRYRRMPTLQERETLPEHKGPFELRLIALPDSNLHPEDFVETDTFIYIPSPDGKGYVLARPYLRAKNNVMRGYMLDSIVTKGLWEHPEEFIFTLVNISTLEGSPAKPSSAGTDDLYDFYPIQFLRREGIKEFVCNKQNPVTIRLSSCVGQRESLLVEIRKDEEGYYAVAVDETENEICERYYFEFGVYIGRDPETSRLTMWEWESEKFITSLDVGGFVSEEHAFITVRDADREELNIFSAGGLNSASSLDVRILSRSRIISCIEDSRAQLVGKGTLVFEDAEFRNAPVDKIGYNIWEIQGSGFLITDSDNDFLSSIGLNPYGRLYTTGEEVLDALHAWEKGIRDKQCSIRSIIRESLMRNRLSLLFACAANVRRSAIMHIVTENFAAKHNLQSKIGVSSHGLHPMPIRDIRRAQQINDNVKKVALERGVSPEVVERFLPRTLEVVATLEADADTLGSALSADDINRADIIFVAEEYQRDLIIDMVPGAASKVFLFYELASPTSDRYGQNVPDSIEEFEHIQRVLEKRLFPLLLPQASVQPEVEGPGALPLPDLQVLRSIHCAA